MVLKLLHACRCKPNRFGSGTSYLIICCYHHLLVKKNIVNKCACSILYFFLWIMQMGNKGGRSGRNETQLKGDLVIFQCLALLLRYRVLPSYVCYNRSNKCIIFLTWCVYYLVILLEPAAFSRVNRALNFK